MIRIDVSVSEGDLMWTWGTEVSSSIVEVVRASKNPAVVADLLELILTTAVSVVVDPKVVPPGAQKVLGLN